MCWFMLLFLWHVPARRIRSHRRSPGNRCSGSNCRRMRADRLAARRTAAASSSCAVSSIAGVQKPHCNALRLRRRRPAGPRWRPESEMPSMVSTRAPSHCTARVRQPRTITSSTRTVQAPHAVLAADMASGPDQASRAGNRPASSYTRLDALLDRLAVHRHADVEAHARSMSCLATRRSSTPAKCFFTSPVAWMSLVGSRSSALTASSIDPPASASSALRARTGVAPTPK